MVATAVASPTTNNVTLYWGDGRIVLFTYNVNGTFTAPKGINDTLTGNTTSGYTLLTKDQVSYHFGKINAANTYGLSTISDTNHNTITLTWNTSLQVTAITDPTGRKVSITYVTLSGSRTVPNKVTDPQNRVWTFAYATNGDLSSITWPIVSGATPSMAFAYGNSNLLTVTDLRGNSRHFTYNTDNSTATETNAVGNTTSFTYTSTATTVTDANGHATVFTFNPTLQQLTSIKDPTNLSQYYAYDANYNTSQIVDRNSHTWTMTFDTHGNELSVDDPNGNTTTFAYNAYNQLTLKTLPSGDTDSVNYDVNGNSISLHRGSSVTNFTVDTYGEITAKSGATNGTYTYDANGDLASSASGGGHVTAYTYNALGVALTRTDANGVVTHYTLDGWNRATAAVYPTYTYSFVYDNNNNLTSFTDNTGTTTRTYDANNRVLAEAKNGGVILTHVYDAAGQKGLLSQVFDGPTTSAYAQTFAYTARNEIAKAADGTSITGPCVNLTYDGNGQQVGATYPNGAYTMSVYDPGERLTQRYDSLSSGTNFSWTTYSYSVDGQIGTKADDSGSTAYQYMDRYLVQETRTGNGSSYWGRFQHNDDGSVEAGHGLAIVPNSDGGVTQAYNFTDTFCTYTYDNNGNQITRNINSVPYTLTYDYENNLTSVSGNGQAYSYQYDALGRRVARTANGSTTYYRYDGTNVTLETTDGYAGTAVKNRYFYGNDLVRCDSISGPTTSQQWLAGDQQGNQTSSTDASQTVLNHTAYDAYGQAMWSSGTSAAPYQYCAKQGYRTDSPGGDCGLIWAGSRYYDPLVCSFITIDTDLSQSPYGYCNGDPVNNIDPTGHFSFGAIFKIFGKFVGAIAGFITGIKQVWTGINEAISGIRMIIAGHYEPGFNMLIAGLGAIAVGGLAIEASYLAIQSGLPKWGKLPLPKATPPKSPYFDPTRWV